MTTRNPVRWSTFPARPPQRNGQPEAPLAAECISTNETDGAWLVVEDEIAGSRRVVRVVGHEMLWKY